MTRPPFWRTLKESCKGLGSVTMKINTQHTHTRPPFWRTLKESCKGLGSVSLKTNTQHTHRVSV